MIHDQMHTQTSRGCCETESMTLGPKTTHCSELNPPALETSGMDPAACAVSLFLRLPQFAQKQKFCISWCVAEEEENDSRDRKQLWRKKGEEGLDRRTRGGLRRSLSGSEGMLDLIPGPMVTR